MPEEAGRDGVSSSAWRAAGAHKYNVDDLPELQGLAVVPADGQSRVFQHSEGVFRAGGGLRHDGVIVGLGMIE